MGASIEVKPCAKGTAVSRVVIDAMAMVEGLTQLANLPEPPTRAIRAFLSSVRIEQTDQSEPIARKRVSAELSEPVKRKQRGEREKTSFKCDICSSTYAYSWNLLRHVKTAHPEATEAFECEECDYKCASKMALESHLDKHATSSETTKSPSYKCAFCKKELASIYYHYASKHKIEYPEQIMFDSGNVLVHSSINPDGGKAPWFLREKEKMIRYTDVTCRLCEAETCFDNREKLLDHYLMEHMVDLEMIENLQRVFRAEKGAHLIDLPASQTPKRKQSNIITLVKQKVARMEENGSSSNADLKEKFEDRSGKKPEPSNIFDCKECDQTYTKEALLNKHKNDKHAPKLEDKAKGVKYKCCLCNKDLAGIYKHYGKVHEIEYPEQILFENGNVLVRTDIATNGGQAPWFISQKEKAENKYSSSTCRLCDADFYGTGINLEKHYIIEHKVEQDVLKRLNNLRCLFRADKGAHLVDMPTSRPTRRVSSHQSTSRQVNESKSKSGPKENSNLNPNENGQDIVGLIIYQCLECGVAATTCDASIEHAQLHHFAGYKAIPLTCGVCKFSFEAQCFSDHSSNHLNNNEYRIVKFDPSKLLEKWSDMFQGLSENHADRIKSSSTYQYTRRVKMNSNLDSGIPLYQCGKCELYVRPKDVEGHCYNYNCIENQTPGHFCPDCDIYFYTSVALTEHERDHKIWNINGANCFRTVTFNCKEDEPINRALQNIQNNLSLIKQTPREKASASEKTQKNKEGGIQIIEDVVVSVFCDLCKQSILFSDLEAHRATHKIDENTEERETNERVQILDKNTQKHINVDSNDNKNENEILTHTDAIEVTNAEGTVELWNSQTDSWNSQNAVTTVEVRVEVHVNKEEFENDCQNENNADNMQDTANSESDVEYILDEFSEEMEIDLKRDIQHLGLELFGMTYIPDENLDDKDLLKEHKTELSEPKETSKNDCSQNDDKKMAGQQNVDVDDTENKARENANKPNDIIEINDDSDDEIEFITEDTNLKSDLRVSSRDILSKMLSI